MSTTAVYSQVPFIFLQHPAVKPAAAANCCTFSVINGGLMNLRVFIKLSFT